MIKASKVLFVLIVCLMGVTQLYSSENKVFGAESGAVIVEPEFRTEELVVADIIVQAPAYNVDPSGAKDSTAAIKSALEEAFEAGGGTVFLPKGNYRITGNITIPPFTALRGDYNDPDLPGFNGDYGTVILADVPETEANFPALFTIGGSAAVIGVTVYYPKQEASSIKPYPYTFEVPSFAGIHGQADHMASTIRDVTLINAYKGIAASITSGKGVLSAANEMIHIENVKGTVLLKGAELYNSSEYGVVRQITFNNAYWAGAGSLFDPPDKSQLDAFTLKYGIGMLVGDLEWVQFTDIKLADYKIGVRVFDGLRRQIAGQPEIYFIGQFYNLRVSNAVTAMRVDNMFPNFGITIADSYLEGSLFSIRNMDNSNALIKLVSTELKGDSNGIRILRSGGDSAYAGMRAGGELPDTSWPIPVNPPSRLFNAAAEFGADPSGKSESAQAIQAALTAADKAGGGIVYMPAGYYKVSGPLLVPANTELRGSAASASRDQIGMSRGTLILADYGYTDSDEIARNADALITLTGDNAGLRGLRVVYPGNEPNTDTGAVRLHAYTVRGLANDNYVMNVSLVGSTYGIEFRGTEADLLRKPIVRNVSGTYYKIGIHMHNTVDGHIEEALANATVVSRNGLMSLFPEWFTLNWPSDANGGLTRMYDLVTRPNTHFIVAENAADLTIGNTFTYGSHTVLKAVDSSIKIYNSAGDNLYPADGKLFDMTGGSLTGVNIMRYSGIALAARDSLVHLFNRITLAENSELDIVSGIPMPAAALPIIEKLDDDLPEAYHYDPQETAQEPLAAVTASHNAEHNEPVPVGSGRKPFIIIGAIAIAGIVAAGIRWVIKRR